MRGRGGNGSLGRGSSGRSRQPAAAVLAQQRAAPRDRRPRGSSTAAVPAAPPDLPRAAFRLLQHRRRALLQLREPDCPVGQARRAVRQVGQRPAVLFRRSSYCCHRSAALLSPAASHLPQFRSSYCRSCWPRSAPVLLLCCLPGMCSPPTQPLPSPSQPRTRRHTRAPLPPRRIILCPLRPPLPPPQDHPGEQRRGGAAEHTGPVQRRRRRGHPAHQAPIPRHAGHGWAGRRWGWGRSGERAWVWRCVQRRAWVRTWAGLYCCLAASLSPGCVPLARLAALPVPASACSRGQPHLHPGLLLPLLAGRPPRPGRRRQPAARGGPAGGSRSSEGGG